MQERLTVSQKEPELIKILIFLFVGHKSVSSMYFQQKQIFDGDKSAVGSANLQFLNIKMNI